MTDWQTAKARACKAVDEKFQHAGMSILQPGYIDEVLQAAFQQLRDSGYMIVRSKQPPPQIRSAGFQAHANGGPMSFGAAYEAMVAEAAKETAG